MRVLITGGAGYIGYALVRQLMFAPGIDEIVIYDNLSRKNYAFFDHQKFIEKPVRFIQGDVLDGRKLEKALKGIDVVYHLAAKVTAPQDDVDAHYYDQINHWGSAQLAYCIEKSQVKHIIYLSSTAVYGNSTDPVDENYTPHPQTHYGISKLAGEQQLQRLEGHCAVHIVRAGNIYGYNPAYRIDAVVNRFVFEAHFQGRVSVQGSGSQQRSFLHVDKLAAGLRQIPDANMPSGIYNFAEHNWSVNDILQSLQRFYPDLEQLYINPNMPRRNSAIELPVRLLNHIKIPAISLDEEIKAFQQAFSFNR